MELQLFGINHKTSNVFERENFIINESSQIILDDCFKKNFGDDINSFFGISTCNRTEIYLLGKANIAREALEAVYHIATPLRHTLMPNHPL